MSLPTREDVDPEYRFDLTRIFETPADWDAAVETLRERLGEGSPRPAEYHDFLRNTGGQDVLAQFESLGIDVTSAEPYERAAETFDGYLDESYRNGPNESY